ncbi:Armadillo-type fold [Phytophthora cactorum]|nr:Armadillo-type fold [Phytophthora cactorum]
MSGDSESVDDERDAISPTPPAEGTSASAYVEQVLRSFGSSFALAALEFLSEIAESSPEMTPEQLRALEQIVDRAMGEARGRLCCSGNSNAKELYQERGGRLGDVLVAAFQLAASQLKVPDTDTHQLLWRCEQVVDVLWSVGVEERKSRDQRLLWQELLCHRWDEVAASLALELLLRYSAGDRLHVYAPSCCTEKVLPGPSGYTRQHVRRRRTDDPVHRTNATAIGATRAPGAFLDDSDDLDIMQWLCEYFPECCECCGVVIQLLSEQSDDEKAENDIGMIRLLDMCLLVIKAGLDYFETKRDDVCALLKYSLLRSLRHCLTLPVVMQALYLLTRIVAVIEGDECHALVKIFEKLLAPSTTSCFSTARPTCTILLTCFDAVHQICVHSSVADVIGPPLIELLQVGSSNVGTLRHCICSRFVGGQQVDTAENSESVASNLSDTDLDDVQSAADVFDALVSDQERVSVLRPDVPQWFDEDDSEGSDSEQEAGVPLQTDVDENGSSQVECLASTTTVPQWFEDVDDEEEPDVDLLQCASENSNSLPEALGLATQWERDTCAVDRVIVLTVRCPAEVAVTATMATQQQEQSKLRSYEG